MKSALILVISPLFLIGVVGNTDEVSVMEGDSITLHTDVTEILTDDEIEWRLNGTRIAKITNEENISLWISPDQSFRDRLILNSQTGDLKIRNIRITDFGQYKLKITTTRGTTEKTFTVRKLKSVSVMEGDSATLNSGLTEIQRDDVICWSFGKTIIAEIIKADQPFSTYDDVLDGRFRDRLKLDEKTGSLTITNITNTDSGEYEVEIISTNRFIIQKRINVTVNETVNSVLVMKGDSVTLHSDASIPRNYTVLWFIKDVHITPLTGRWSNTAQNNQTEDLTIRNIRRDQSGDYKVIFMDIQKLSMSIHRKFHITVTGVFSDETDGVKTVSVMKGDPVSLNTSVTEIQKGDLIEWLFGPQNITIVKTDGKNNSISYNDKDVRFKNRLNLDNRTGDLTIKNSSSEHSGRYQLKIINNNTYTIQKSFSVTVNSGLSPGAIGVIVIAVLAAVTAAVAGVIYSRHKSSKPQRSREVNGQNHTSNKDEETELAKPAEVVE